MIRKLLPVLIILMAASISHAQSPDANSDKFLTAEAYLSDGKPEEARKLFEQLIKSSRKRDITFAKAKGGLGLAFAALGEPYSARQSLEDSISIATELGQNDLIAKSRFNLALVALSELGRDVAPTEWFSITRGDETKREVFWKEEERSKDDLRFALDELENAAQEALSGGDVSLSIKAWATAAKYESDTNANSAFQKIEQAFRVLPESLESSYDIEAALLIGEVAVSIVPLLKDKKRGPSERIAFLSLDKARLASQAISDARLESYSIGLLARLYGLKGQLEDATKLSERAVYLAERAGANEILFVWNGQLASYFERLGNNNAALSAYQRAAENIQAVRADLSKSVAGAGQVSSRELIEPILLGYADLLLKTGSEDDIRDARDVVETLKTIEFERFFEETCVANSIGKKTDLNSASDTAAVLYPIIFSDRMELLVSIGDTIVREKVNISRSDLEFRVRSARNQLRRDNKSMGPLEDLSLLYDWLILPVVPHLEEANVRTIVFAPDGALRGLPIAALYKRSDETGARGRFLIEDYAVAATIGLTLIDPEPFERVQRLGVHAGVAEALTVPSASDGKADTRFSELGAVLNELNSIADLIPGPKLLNENFTKDNFEETLKNSRFTVAHLATHATFGRTASESYLLAHSGVKGRGERISLDELEEYTAQARIRGEPIELLTLSACETGVGDPDAESENAMLGLAGVAYKAGARSVLASLWQVYDESTGALMADFYRNLTTGVSEFDGAPMSKAEALQKAQLRLLYDPSGNTKHPSHWAAFILFGNWL